MVFLRSAKLRIAICQRMEHKPLHGKNTVRPKFHGLQDLFNRTCSESEGEDSLLDLWILGQVDGPELDLLNH